MTHFPHNPAKRPAPKQPAAPATAKPGLLRDLLWGRPVFKAPALPNPRVAFDPLPFTATRATHRPAPRRP